MGPLWKQNWKEVEQHHLHWWDREGCVLSKYWQPLYATQPVERIDNPGPPECTEQLFMNAVYRAKWSCFNLSQQTAAGDTIPLAWTDLGPGSLAAILGSEPCFDENTVWYEPCITNPDLHPPIVFDSENCWWKLTLEILDENINYAQGRYFVPCPDLVENLDTLASLRGTQNLLMDLIERPDWVKQKLFEISKAYFEVYDRIYDRIRMDDGGSTYGAFWLWGPGKTIKVQCDISAMLSPELFCEFALPHLKEQCQLVDYSIYHLDGSTCIQHLEHILSIEALDAVEFTPDPNCSGTDPKWFDLYDKILRAGKSVQIVDARKEEVIPLIKELGAKGLYICVSDFKNESELINLYYTVHKHC